MSLAESVGMFITPHTIRWLIGAALAGTPCVMSALLACLIKL